MRIAEVIQRGILRDQGKEGKAMKPQDWNGYIKANPKLEACLDTHCRRIGDYGTALGNIYKTLSGRIHAAKTAEELEFNEDYIILNHGEGWLSREQVLCIACILTHEMYPFRIEPAIPGFGIIQAQGRSEDE